MSVRTDSRPPPRFPEKSWLRLAVDTTNFAHTIESRARHRKLTTEELFRHSECRNMWMQLIDVAKAQLGEG